MHTTQTDKQTQTHTYTYACHRVMLHPNSITTRKVFHIFKCALSFSHSLFFFVSERGSSIRRVHSIYLSLKFLANQRMGGRGRKGGGRKKIGEEAIGRKNVNEREFAGCSCSFYWIFERLFLYWRASLLVFVSYFRSPPHRLRRPFHSTVSISFSHFDQHLTTNTHTHTQSPNTAASTWALFLILRTKL